jgi:hypothetical protein
MLSPHRVKVNQPFLGSNDLGGLKVSGKLVNVNGRPQNVSVYPPFLFNQELRIWAKI